MQPSGDAGRGVETTRGNDQVRSGHMKKAVRGRCSSSIGKFCFILSLTSCAGTGQYDSFAQAGITYTNAADPAFGAFRRLSLELSAERLQAISPPPQRNTRRRRTDVQTGFDFTQCSRAPANTESRPDVEGQPSIFSQFVCQSMRRVELTRELEKHTRRLRGYFTALDDLAKSDAAAQAGAAATAALDGASKIGDQLRVRLPGEFGAIPAATRLVTDLVVRQRLRSRLVQDERVLRRELQTQDRALEFLMANTADEQRNLLQQRFERQIVAPWRVGSAPTLGDQWNANYVSNLDSPDSADALSTARRAVASLTAALDEIIKGGDASAAVGQAVADANALLDIIEPLARR